MPSGGPTFPVRAVDITVRCKGSAGTAL